MSTHTNDDDLQGEMSQPYMGNGRSVRLITFCGQTHTIKKWSEITGFPLKTLYQRLANKWPVERILTKIPSANSKYQIECPDGVIRNIGETADMCGLSRNTVYSRIRRGTALENCFSVSRRESRSQQEIRLSQYDFHVQDMIRLVGQLHRNGEPIPSEWFEKLDNCLDALWEIRNEIGAMFAPQ